MVCIFSIEEIQMNLKLKKNPQLIADLKKLVQHERDTTLEILHHLRELELRFLHLEEGYPSLFEWTTQVLGYSAGAAQRRIQSMRLIKSLPELEAKI